MQIPDEMLKEIRESGYDQELVFKQIRKLLESDKPIKENEYNLELIYAYLRRYKKKARKLPLSRIEVVHYSRGQIFPIKKRVWVTRYYDLVLIESGRQDSNLRPSAPKAPAIKVVL